MMYGKNDKMNNLILSIALKKIKSMLEIAYKYGGEVFGGYVRDVLVVQENKIERPISFKDVDIWFKCKENAQKFITEMGEKIKIGSHQTVAPGGKNIYEFQRTNYAFYSKGYPIAFIDVIVSGTIPVNDFDVNFLTYHKGIFKSYHYRSEIDLVCAIKEKTIRITPKYMKRILEEDRTNGELGCHVRRIENRYLDRGWKIKLPNGEFWDKNTPAKLTMQFLAENVAIYNKNIEEYKISEIKNMLRGVFLEGGKVFGGYVTDLLVPSLNMKPTFKFEDVNIWFTKNKNADNFINRTNGRIVCEQNIIKGSWEKRICSFYIKGIDAVCVNIFISVIFPVRDLDVNCLTYGKSGFIPSSTLSINKILERNATMLEEYWEIVKTNHSEQKKLRENYLYKGWKIYLPGGMTLFDGTIPRKVETPQVETPQLETHQLETLKNLTEVCVLQPDLRSLREKEFNDAWENLRVAVLNLIKISP